MDAVRDALQRWMDEAYPGEGWTVGHFAAVFSIERFTSDGRLESEPWHAAPASQPEWITDALLEQAMRARETVEDRDE